MFSGTSESTVVPVILESAGLTEDDVEIVQGPPPTSMYTALLQDRIDVLMGIGNETTELEILDPSLDFKILSLAEFGIDSMAHGIITTDEMVETQPDIVAAFVRGAQKTWEYVLSDPAHLQDAVDAAAEAFPSIRESATDGVLLQQLEAQIATLRAGAPADAPLGYVSEEAWERSLLLVNVLGESDTPITSSAEDVYTNEFLSDDIVMPPA
jgi:NitT/TauT family transport system substrate-binding protein